jgi:hypothetical protein
MEGMMSEYSEVSEMRRRLEKAEAIIGLCCVYFEFYTTDEIDNDPILRRIEGTLRRYFKSPENPKEIES